MRRQPLFFAAALLLPCAALALCALALAPRAAGQSATNVNVNMNRNTRGNVNSSAAEGVPPSGTTTLNLNTNSSAATPRPSPPAATPPAVRWSRVASVEGFLRSSPVKLRASADARAADVEEVEANDYPPVELLETAGEFVRVRFETGGGEGRKGKVVEGWAVWGDVMPHTTALILDARTGRVTGRTALGPGIDAVSFSPDGKRALFHGQWSPHVYEADASHLAPTRRLSMEGEGGFNAPVYVGSGHELLAPFWSSAPAGDGGGQKLYVARVDGGGGVSAAPFPRAPSGAEPSRVAFAPDGRTGFAFYVEPFDDEEDVEEPADGAERGTPVAVFDPLTMQHLRRFHLPGPGLSFDASSMAMNADGSLFYVIDQTGQRLVVVETQAGGVVREVSLAGDETRLFSLARDRVDASGPLLVNYWVAAEDHGDAGTLRLDGGLAAEADAGPRFTVEAGGARYGVDEAGTRLLILDADGRVLRARDIPRREEDMQTPVGLFATPDGSRLIILLSVPEHDC